MIKVSYYELLMANKKGFTLIELLVVIAIVGLLGTISVIALNSARAKARDVKRMADARQIVNAMEMHFNDNGFYPYVYGFHDIYSHLSGWALLEDQLSPYMSKLPVDPKNKDPFYYIYHFDSYTNEFYFRIRLEEENPNLSSSAGSLNGSYYFSHSFLLGKGSIY